MFPHALLIPSDTTMFTGAWAGVTAGCGETQRRGGPATPGASRPLCIDTTPAPLLVLFVYKKNVPISDHERAQQSMRIKCNSSLLKGLLFPYNFCCFRAVWWLLPLF